MEKSLLIDPMTTNNTIYRTQSKTWTRALDLDTDKPGPEKPGR